MTQKQYEWIQQHKHIRGYFKLFNKHFKTNYPDYTIRYYGNHPIKNKKYPISQEQKEWIIAHSPDYISNLTKEFNKHFNLNYSYKKLEPYIKKNNIPYKSARRKSIPIGTLLIGKHKDNVRVRIKTEQGYIQANKYYYLQYHGSIPHGHKIINLDGNPLNFSKENLYAISQKDIITLRHMSEQHNQDLYHQEEYTQAICEINQTEELIND